MSDPNDPTIPLEPTRTPEESPPEPPPSSDGPPSRPADPTLPYGTPPGRVGSAAPGQGGTPPSSPPGEGGGDGGGGDGDLPPEPPEEPEGWWGRRTAGEKWAMAVGVILLGVLVTWLIISGGDEDTPTTTTVGETTTTAGETTTTTADTTTVDDTTTTTEETTTTVAGETTTTAVETTTTTTTTAPLPPPPTVEGNGSATIGFAIPDDLPAAVEITHAGTESFVVIALDADRNEIGVLVDRVGDYRGTVGVNLDPDAPPVTSLQFSADGNWTAQATYLDDLDPMTLGGLSGTGDSVVRLGPMVSTEQASFTHDGVGPFVVVAHTADGAADTLVETEGEFAGTVGVPSGSALLVITADGSWTVTTG